MWKKLEDGRDECQYCGLKVKTIWSVPTKEEHPETMCLQLQVTQLKADLEVLRTGLLETHLKVSGLGVYGR